MDKPLEWTPYRVMPETHHLYGRKCGAMTLRTNYQPCKGSAVYISTMGFCAVVRCEQCHQDGGR